MASRKLFAVISWAIAACSEPSGPRTDGTGADAAVDAGTDGSTEHAPADGGELACPDDPRATSADPSRVPERDPALPARHAFFTLHVEDTDGQPIRGAKLTTVNKIELVSDDHGVAAFYEPGLMDQRVFFHVAHIGYQVPADGFGFRGKAVDVTEGGSATFVLEKASGELPAAQGDLQSRLVAGPVPQADDCFALRFVDAASGRGVPLVRATAFGEALWSDSQGMIAYCHPDHLDAEASFEVFSHGYAPASATLMAQRGHTETLALTRTMVAERLYRISGAGIYRDSVLLGLTTPTARPVLNALVAGSDTASTAIYRGKLFWMWQDTDRVAYPLGNFRGTSAFSMLEPGGLSPQLGADLDYFVGEDGFAKPMSEDFEPGGAPVWIAGLVSVPDAEGEERLFAGYAKVRGLGDIAEAGVMRFDDAAGEFKRVVTDLLEDGFVRPDGHAFQFRHGADAYAYYPDRLRIPASAEAMTDRARYEQFSPFAAQGSAELVRDANGELDYAFRPGAKHATSAALDALGVADAQDLDGHDVNVESGEKLTILAPSTAWNAYRQRFVRISQVLGPMGDLYHAEADTPVGPWVHAQRVIQHEQYTFYNAFHHPEFDRDGGRTVFVEGTYTTTFTFPEPVPTPRYNYNQVMYRLDLGDPALSVPVAVYQVGEELVIKEALRPGEGKLVASFFAQDHAASGAVPVAWSGAACEERVLEVGGTPKTKPIFYALPPENTPSPSLHAALHEYRHADGRRAYDVAGAALEGFERVETPLAWVWANPVRVALPVRDYLSELRADAGVDQCTDAGTITLDGAQSSAGASPIVRYVWSLPGSGACERIEGARLTVDLPPGLHSIDLTVMNAAGQLSTDTVIVRVR